MNSKISPKRKSNLSRILRNEAINWAIYLIIVGFFILLWAAHQFSSLPANSPSLTNLANFGQFVSGPVAGLWSLAGLLFVFAAFRLQSEQNNMQNNENEAQHQTQYQQQFENTFFHLLQLHNDIVNAIDTSHFVIPGYSEVIRAKGRGSFHVLYTGLAVFIRESRKAINQGDGYLEVGYNDFYGRSGSEIGHYFRNLYHIIKFVDNSNVQDQKFYTNIVRAQLSNNELFLLFYNGISNHGTKFKPLIEKYALFHNMPKNGLLDPLHFDLYNPNAYEGS